MRDDRGDGGAARRPAGAARAVARRDVPHGGLPGGVDPPRRHRGPRRRPPDRARAPRRRAELGRRRVLRSARPHLADALRLPRGGDVPPPRPHPRAASDADAAARPRARQLRPRIRHGRACRGARDRSARAPAAQPCRPRPALRAALVEQVAPRMLRGRRGAIRLAGPASRASVDARRPMAHRMGHGERHVSRASAARRRPRGAPGGRHGGRPVGHARPRHRHLYRHEPGRRGDARAARGPRALRDGRQRLARVSARGRVDDGGERGAGGGRGRPGAPRPDHRRGVRGRSVAPRRPRSRRASRSGTG